MNDLFPRCNSLISLPDISKWNHKNLEELSSIFPDCPSLLYIPDLSKWEIYNEYDINKDPDYNFADKIDNIDEDDYSIEQTSPDDFNFYNDPEILLDKIGDKYLKILEKIE